MAKEIFDQERPRSAMAQRLDEAFTGCDEWTLAPPAPRRNELAFPPRRAARPQLFDAASELPESRAA
jgi:hypothetical protein